MPPAISLVEGMFATGMISSVTNTTHREQTNLAIAIRSPRVLTDSVVDASAGMSARDFPPLGGSADPGDLDAPGAVDDRASLTP